MLLCTFSAPLPFTHAMLNVGANRRPPGCSQDTRGIPQVQRDLQQVEALSRNLRAKTARLDAGAETIAATHLLAHEGLNTRK